MLYICRAVRRPAVKRRPTGTMRVELSAAELVVLVPSLGAAV